MTFKEEIITEWHRLIRNEGLTLEPCQGEEEHYIKQSGQEVGRITEEGEVFCKPDHKEVMDTVFGFFISAKEYVSAYCNAPEGELPSGYRKISELGQYVFAAKQLSDSSYQFVTWQYSSYDHRSVAIGNYFSNYEAAKTDFGIRTGMVDRSKLFKETELAFLHKHLSHYLRLNNYISFDDEKDVLAILDKIKQIVPECSQEDTLAIEPDEDFEQE